MQSSRPVDCLDEMLTDSLEMDAILFVDKHCLHTHDYAVMSRYQREVRQPTTGRYDDHYVARSTISI